MRSSRIFRTKGDRYDDDDQGSERDNCSNRVHKRSAHRNTHSLVGYLEMKTTHSHWLSHMEFFAVVGNTGRVIVKCAKVWGDTRTMEPVKGSITILGDDGLWYPLPIVELARWRNW